MPIRLKVHPIYGTLDVVYEASVAEYARKASEFFDCAESVSVGDVVVTSQTLSDTVETVSTNVYDGLVLGIVITKVTSTRCEVLISGKLEGFSGLDGGKVIWVGTDGKITTNKPTTGHLQKMGVAMNSNNIFLLHAMDKVIQS